MNEQLNTYVYQARQAGKSDELIRQELLGAGWSENDVLDAFAALAAKPAASLTSPDKIAAGLGFSAKAIVAIILVLLTGAGLGLYFFLSGKDSTTPPSFQNTAIPASEANGFSSPEATFSFTCRDLLPDDEFERITGANIKDYKIINQGTPEFSYSCYYVTNEQYEKNLKSRIDRKKIKDQMELNITVIGVNQSINTELKSNDFFVTLDLTIGKHYEFQVLHKASAKESSDWYNGMLKTAIRISTGNISNVKIQSSAGNQTYNTTATLDEKGGISTITKINNTFVETQWISKSKVTELSGVGTSSYVKESVIGGAFKEITGEIERSPNRELIFLATNSKFSVIITTDDKMVYNDQYKLVIGKKALSIEELKNMGRIIDSNLNKY